jgi:hypothetical protein
VRNTIEEAVKEVSMKNKIKEAIKAVLEATDDEALNVYNDYSKEAWKTGVDSWFKFMESISTTAVRKKVANSAIDRYDD